MSTSHRCCSFGLPALLAVATTFALPLNSHAAEPAQDARPDFLARHAQAAAANPEGFRFTIEFATEQTRFRVGEVIPLNLEYSFDRPDRYSINDGLAQGSGTARLLEVFRVAPQTGIRRRTAEEPSFHFGAGGTPQHARTDRVYRYPVVLNEWLRFDAPGKYRIFATSARVWKSSPAPNQNNDLQSTSNWLDLEIIPAKKAWQAELLRAAVATLDRSDKPAERRQRCGSCATWTRRTRLWNWLGARPAAATRRVTRSAWRCTNRGTSRRSSRNCSGVWMPPTSW